MIDISFLKELDRFNIILKRRVLSKYHGERQSHAEGQGLIFADYKDYVPGDDFRAIDWKVYARTDKFFIKQFEEERNMTVHIIVDASGSMDYGREKYKKYVRSKSFIILISDLLYDIEEIKAILSRFTRHEVIVIQVLDPTERKLVLYGDIILEDSERHKKLRTFISNRLLRNYRDKIEYHIQAIKDACEH